MKIINDSKWQDRFIKLARMVASWSKDRSTQVGAVIVTGDGHPRSFGFNGMPQGVNDDIDERHERPEKYFWFEHAERNAIYLADGDLKDCVMFVTHMPCADCARAIIQTGIAHVVVDAQGKLSHGTQLSDSCTAAREMFFETGVYLIERYVRDDAK
jgi:dCMP deaminase